MFERVIADLMTVGYGFFPAFEFLFHSGGDNIKCSFHTKLIQQSGANFYLTFPGIIERKANGNLFSVRPREGRLRLCKRNLYCDKKKYKQVER